MAIPSGWRGERGRRGSPMSGSASEDEGPPCTPQRSALHPRAGSDHRRPYSPVAETLFRKDLISAMKLPDNEPLEAEDYWTVTDTWKQEWERGVQVPVKPNTLPEPHVSSSSISAKSDRFTLPKKLICMNTSGSYKAETHQVTPMVLRAEQVCTYDLDNVDQHWLFGLNGERARTGQSNLTETEMERSVEELERQCWDKINSTLRNSDDVETAQDDSIICDVCRSPDSEESNEMVFCDQCNICVHQACYGITTIPSGSWLCRTCVPGIKPPCELCPNKGGAMKSTRTGSKWAHVSCALWIPEVSIGCVEKMEPITKISSIPQSRWSLLCVLCKERMGSCIQCSVKTCKTAYHVTCAFKHNLEMRAIIEDESAEDGVKLRSYCQKHSLNSKKKAAEDSDSESGLGSRKSTMTAEERSQARRQKMAKVEKEFYKLVDVAVGAKKVQLSEELMDIVYKYWVLKRVAGGNKPLLPPKGEDEVLSALRGEDTERDKMKKLVSIRQDLERVRNLAYMVSRREKISRGFVKLREQILEKQLALLADEEPSNQMSLAEMSAVIEANHGPSVYDKMLSNPDTEQHTHDDFEVIISRISGEIKDGSSQIRKDNPRLDFRKKSLDTPQKEKLYERIFSDTSQSESDDSFIHNVNPKSKTKTPKKKGPDKGLAARPSKAGKSSSKAVVRSDSSMSSGEEVTVMKKLASTKNVGSSKLIYSDSDSDKSETEKSPRKRGRPSKSKLKDIKNNKTESVADSDSTQHSLDRPKEFKTKAAMKEFTAADAELARKIMEEKKAYASKNKSKPAYVSSDEDSVMEVDADVNNDFLLVPQRKAASKAQKKIVKAEDKKKKAQTAGLFGSSEDESSSKKSELSKNKKNKKKQTSTDSESDAEPTTKVKTKVRSKHSSPDKKDKKSKHLSDPVKISPKEKAKKGIMDFTDSEEEPSQLRKKAQESPRKSSKKPTAVDNILLGLSDDSDYGGKNKRTKGKTAKSESSEDEALLAAKQASALEYEKQQSGQFDTLFQETKSQTDSGTDTEEDRKRKKIFDDFENPHVPLFVPQRRAAKKATAQLSEGKLYKKSQQEAYIKELAQIKAKKAAVEGRGRTKSGGVKGSESEKARARSSDSQSSSGSSNSDDSESDTRMKSPRGRGRSPKSKVAKVNTSIQKKSGTKSGAGRGKQSPRSKKDVDGKIKSSSALEYLMQRESQITNMLKSLDDEEKEQGDGWIRTEESVKPNQVTPDKKLKTSEGQQPQGFVHSPPDSPKASSNSDSNSDSDDSVIKSIKERKKKESERQQPSSESKKKDEDLSLQRPPTPGSTNKRASSRDNSFSDSGPSAVQSKRYDSDQPGSTDPLLQESGARRPGCRAGDSSDGGLEPGPARAGRPSREASGGSRERASRQAPAQSQQLKPSPGQPAGQKGPQSMFSPERSPRTAADPSRDERETGPGSWRSPRDRKQAEQLAAKEKILPSSTKSPAKSPAVSRGFGEGSRSSPLQTHRSPAFGRSPARHSQHPLNKSLDSSKGDLTDPKLTITPNKSDNEPEEERPSIDSRKFSVESKDSDADSAKSSLPDANVNGLPDFSKEDSTDTLFADKVGDLRDGKGKEQAPAHKTDEGYVSAEKVQTTTPPTLPSNDIGAQDISGKPREMPSFPNFQSNITSDKFSHKEADKTVLPKPNSRLSTDDSISSLELGLPKATNQSAAWSELERLSSSQSAIQQHLLEEQRNYQMQQQQQQQQRSLSEDQKMVDALAATQQQAQYEAFLNQMYTMQRAGKAGHEITQQQMAYAQQYMKEMGYGKNLGHNQTNLDILSQQINYQSQYNQMSYQHYLQQVQAYGGLNKKVQDQTDMQFLSAVQWQQQQEAWQAYQRMGDLEKMTQGGLREMQSLLSQGKASQGKFSQEQHAQFQKMQTEKRVQEERKKKQEEEEKRRQEEEKRRQEEEKKRQEEEKRQEKRRQEELRLVEEQKKMLDQQDKMRQDDERKRKEVDEQQRMLEQQRMVEQQEKMRQDDERKRKEVDDQQRMNFYQQQQQQQQQRGFDYLKHQQFLTESSRQQEQFMGHRDLVGQVQDQLGALTGHNQTLFGPVSKDQNSNKGVNNNKNDRARPASPKTEKSTCKVEESRREQELLQKQFPQLAFNAIPSATPADTLPGFKPSIPSTRDHKRQSHEFHLETTVDLKARDRATPHSVTGSDHSEPSGIPSCLLDSILETAKLPVWKPPDKTPDQQNFSPAKPPVPSPPKPAPVTSERDNSFDDLVRHIDSSPSQKPDGSKPLKPRDHNSASEAERSDYDHDHQSLGGVDYDDPYGSSDDQPLRQRQAVNNKPEEKQPEAALTKRGTKVPCYAEKDDDSFATKKSTMEDPAIAMAKLKNQPRAPAGRGRGKARTGRGGVFGRRGGPKYDPKAFEKVHKNLAGTDFDIEGEFDDDFGASPRAMDMPTSLKGYREQTKKAPIYLQEGKKDDAFNFDDEPTSNQIPPVLFDDEDTVPEEAPKSKAKSGRGLSRQTKGRQPAERDTMDTPEPVVEEPVKAAIPKVSMSTRVSIPKMKINVGKKDMPERAPVAGEESNYAFEEKPKEAMPKIPTLKIKFGRTDSPVSVGSDEFDFKSKKHRRGSLERTKSKEERKGSIDDEDSTLQKVPKLKIKLGAPPPSKSPVANPMESTSTFPPMSEMIGPEIPPLLIRTTPTSSPRSAKGKVTPRPIRDLPAVEPPSTSELAVEALKAEGPKKSPKSSGAVPFPTPSPKKKGLGSIDSLATKLLAKQQSSSVMDKTSELNNIFGPEEPLKVNMAQQEVVRPKQVEVGEEGPSELELLAMELSNQLAKEKQMKQQKDEATRKEKEADTGIEDEDLIRHHDPKYKFKQLNKPSHSENRNSTSPGPPTPVKINLTMASVAADRAPERSSNPRMRKKELLNQYYGIETVVPVSEAGSTNGPSGLAAPPEMMPEPYRPPVKMNIMREPPIRNVIKMPKAVASVTSVPTRADYQSQLEANLERKRKREGKEPLPGKGKKGGKLKKEEKEYKPKIRMTETDEAEGDGADKVRKTRGKPPKKRVVEESDEDDDPKVSFIESKKNESIKFAEAMLANFDNEEAEGQDGEEEKPERRRKEKKQKRRREEEDSGSQPNTKTPRIVIKFSKNKDLPKNIPKDNNGLTKPSAGISDMQKKIPNLKIKNLIEPNPS